MVNQQLSESSSSLYMLMQENISSIIKFLNTANADYYKLCQSIQINDRRMAEIMTQGFLNWCNETRNYFMVPQSYSSSQQEHQKGGE